MPMAREVEPLKNVKDINTIKQFLYGKSDKRDYTIFVLGINIGLRAGDLLSLKFGDVTDGKNIFEEVTIKEEKTKKIKTFSINDNAKSALQEYFNQFYGINLDNPLFGSRKGGNLGVRPLHAIIKDITTNLGIKGNFGTHTLRKTFAYHRYVNKVPLETIQKMLNHSSSAITLKYIGITKEVIVDCYRAINL